jgi:uncharacterized protein
MLATRFVRWLNQRRRRPRSHASDDLVFDARDFDPPLRTRLLILQPTPFCNIHCDYCYLPNRNSTARMSLETVRLATQRLVDEGLAGDSFTVVWHAGEPLVLPPEYYEQAIASIAGVVGSKCSVSHSIQTNGTLINDAWCELFARHHICVGVSVDGPANLHDRHRKTHRGTGTHAAVVRGMELLRRWGIPFHAIAVITSASLSRADDLIDFFAAQAIADVGYNFDEAEGQHGESSFSRCEAAHRVFLERTLERSIDSAGRLRVRELANAFRLIADEPPTYSWRGERWPDNGQTMPFALISVACNGDFSTFSPELLGQRSAAFADFILGNVHRQSYLASAQGERFRRLWSAIHRGTAACRASCAYFNYCGGGAPANKLYENGSFASAETLYCRTMLKRPFDVVLERLERDQREALS